MAKCLITGKSGLIGNRVSHANNKTRHRQMPNIISKRVWDDENSKWVRLKISTRGLRFLNRLPLSEVRRKYANEITTAQKMSTPYRISTQSAESTQNPR